MNTAIILALSSAFRDQLRCDDKRRGHFLRSWVDLQSSADGWDIQSVHGLIQFLCRCACPGSLRVLLRAPEVSVSGLDGYPSCHAQTHQEFATPAAVLLSALLFFHFGNEWSIAGWLPLLLILRLGLNPVTALTLLALILARDHARPHRCAGDTAHGSRIPNFCSPVSLRRFSAA